MSNPYQASASLPAMLPVPKAHNLRLSVTERCNFRCRYCAPPGGFPKTPYSSLPTLDQLADAAEWLISNWNVTRIKVTGGEPLVRPRLVDMVERLAHNGRNIELSLTTNGSRLKALANPLKRAGLRRVNVSLDTLDAERFQILCGGRLSDTLEGIDAALDAGLAPVKLNTVLHKSNWQSDVPRLLDYAALRGIEVRFIELMPMGPAREWARDEYVSAQTALDWLRGQTRVIDRGESAGTPARRVMVRWRGSDNRVGFITPMSKNFCSDCDRLRLDSHGRLRRCLMDPNVLPLVEMLSWRAGPARAFREVDVYLSGKQQPLEMGVRFPMTLLGG